MAEHKVAAALDDLPLRNLSCDLRERDSPRQKVSPPVGAIVEHAMKCAGIEAKQLADAMGISHTFLLRGFKDQEHVSWQRLFRAAEVYPQFRRWLLIVLAAETQDVHVRTVIEVDGCGGL